MVKIALFGTSADPPTAGHQAILATLANHYDLVAVWAADNPFKNHRSVLQDRVAMVELLIKDLGNPRAEVKLCQQLSDRRSLISVHRAKAIWGDQPEYTLVIGADLVRQIQSWYQVKQLLYQVQLLIVPRPGYPIAEEDLVALTDLGAQWTVASFEVPPVSSSDYRISGDRFLLPSSVAQYIEHKQLYL